MISRWSSCLHIILSLINIISIVILIAGFPKTCQTALQATIHSQVNHALYYNFQCHSLSLINTFSLHALKYHQSILPHLFLKGDNAQGSSDGRVESLKKICSGSVIDSILWTTWYWYCDHIIMPKIYLKHLPTFYLPLERPSNFSNPMLSQSVGCLCSNMVQAKTKKNIVKKLLLYIFEYFIKFWMQHFTTWATENNKKQLNGVIEFHAENRK